MRLRYLRLKVVGWACWHLIRWLPIPFGRPKSVWWSISAYLWGWAYSAHAIRSYDEWKVFGDG